jgi:RimJ/RimL family protein N-acetyltransferase
VLRFVHTRIGARSMPAFDAIPIRTDRLLLRAYRESDAEDLFAIFSNPEVMRYGSSPPWTSVDRAREIIARSIAALESGEHLGLVIERIEDAHLIGQCALFKLNVACRRAEIGYSLAPQAWGNGYMNETLRALIGYGFDRMDLNRIEADVDPRNEPSVRTLERLGFQREGLLRERWIVNGEVSDSVLYGLLRKHWSPEPGRS